MFFGVGSAIFPGFEFGNFQFFEDKEFAAILVDVLRGEGSLPQVVLDGLDLGLGEDGGGLGDGGCFGCFSNWICRNLKIKNIIK